MNCRRALLHISLIMPFLFGIWASASPLSQIEEELKFYFADAFSVEAEKVTFEYRHLPVIAPTQEIIDIIHHERNLKPGHQTIWLKCENLDGSIQKVPVTLDVEVELNLMVARQKISRGAAVHPDCFEFQPVVVSGPISEYLRTDDRITGMVTRQVIPEGSLLKKKMLAAPPDVPRGSRVTVNLISSDLVITTGGKLKRDSMIGEQVQVICDGTSRLLDGVLTSENNVEIQLR